MTTQNPDRDAANSFLSTSEAARLIGVTASTMKRWADEGILSCERTAGGHRRFRRAVLEAFKRGDEPSAAQQQRPRFEREETVSPFEQRWLEALVEGSHHHVVSRLFALRQDCGSWSGVADELGPVLTALGAAWENGVITIAEEHLASECLSRALAQVGLSLPMGHAPRRALLATADGERHELGLRLAELVLRSRQWRSVWIGANTPTDVLARHVETSSLDLVVITASAWMEDVSNLGRIATRMSRVCDARGATLVLGGGGSWPDVPGVARIGCYQEFDTLLAALG